MQRLVIGLFICLVFQVTVWANEKTPGDLAPAWPQANGPFGNFNPRRYQVELVDDLSQARQLWVSEAAVLGFAKGSSSGYVRHLLDPVTHPGTSSGLIVAEGKVFANSVQPTGEVWAENSPNIQSYLQSNQLTPEQLTILKRNTAIDAHDVLIAVDLNTGKTAWQATAKHQGINVYSGKRLQFHGTPAYHQGRVFAQGSTGQIYCYQASDGKLLWTNSEGKFAKVMAEHKAKLLEQKNGFGAGDGRAANLVIANNMLIVPEFYPNHDIGLRGIDPVTGEDRWVIAEQISSRFATPAIWTNNGQQYLVVGSSKGVLRMIDPTTGKILWSVNDLEPMWASLKTSGQHVFVNVKATANPTQKNSENWGRMGAYRLSVQGAEHAWSVPDEARFWFENHMDICAMRRVLCRDGLVYYNTQNKFNDAKQTQYFWHVLDEATGAIKQSTKPQQFGNPTVETPQRTHIGQAWFVEDRVLNMRDAAHSDRATWQWIDITTTNFGQYTPAVKPGHDNTTAYEVFIELPYVEGKFLFRNWQGQIVCYDLRKSK